MSSDTYYVNRCLDGHPDDFRHLVGRYQRVLVAHLVGRLGRLDAAEEAAQETLVRCYFGLSKLKKPGSFFPWMLGVGNRVALEQQRKDVRQREAISEWAEQPRPDAARGYDYPLARVISELPDFYRELVLLRYYGGFSCKAIAEQLEMPIGTVTKTLSRACAVLREKLRRHEGSGECEVQR